jgi:hypothetical protein
MQHRQPKIAPRAKEIAMKTPCLRLAAALALLAPALAFAQPYESCSLISIDEVNAYTVVPAVKTRTNTTRSGNECVFIDSTQKAVFTVEIRGASLPKAELDQEAENLQKIYRTSVKPVEIGQGGFWLTTRYELFFRKGKNIVRVVLAPQADTKSMQVKSESAARLIETRVK